MSYTDHLRRARYLLVHCQIVAPRPTARTFCRTLVGSAALVAGTALVAVPPASAVTVPQSLVTSQAINLVNGWETTP
jgi:hypothetical protein